MIIKRTCKIVSFAVPTDHRVYLKGNEKKNKYLDLAWELKKLWNMKATFTSIVIGALGTVIEGLLKRLEDFEIRGRVETIQTLAVRLAWIPRRVLKIRWDLCHSNASERPSVNADMKTLKE